MNTPIQDRHVNSPDSIDISSIFEPIQFFSIGYLMLIFGAIVLVNLWGFRKISILDLTRYSFLFYGVLWSFFYTDKEIVLVLISANCIWFSLISLLFFRQLKKKEKPNKLVISVQTFFNCNQCQNLRDFFAMEFLQRLKNKNINLIWEFPLICIFVLHLTISYGFCFPYIQKALLLRLTFLVTFFSIWNFIFICSTGFLTVLIYMIKNYFLKIYGQNCLFLLNTKNLLDYLRSFLLVTFKAFLGNIFFLLSYHFYNRLFNILYIASVKRDTAVNKLVYQYNHCIWENFAKKGPEPMYTPLSDKVPLNTDFLTELI